MMTMRLPSSLRTMAGTLGRFYKYGKPSHILYFGESLGDNLLLTTLASALSRRGAKNIWIKCDRPELFVNNADIKAVVPLQALLSTPLLGLFGVKVVHPVYTAYREELDSDIIPDKHIILKMADCLHIRGEIDNKPVLHLLEAEELFGRPYSPYIAIATGTAGAKVPMGNKEWPIERYQEVVDRLSPAFRFVQLGAPGDMPLRNVHDLRGRTTIRESAAILRNVLLLVSHVGFTMHLARAVDCPAVIIYGGRERPEQSGYACFHNLYSEIACSPCWQHNRCAYDRECMKMISAEMVQQAIQAALNRPARAVPVDKLYND
jgi:ADP-heptose:LPS heptosyltransferase